MINAFSFLVGSSIQPITQDTPLDSGDYLYADYVHPLTEVNRPPWVLSVVVTGTYTEDDELTITCIWDKNSSGAVGTPTLGIYRQDNRNTIAGSVARTLVNTLTNGVNVEQGTIVTTTYTYTLVAGDVGKFISFDFTAKVTGVTNTDSAVYSSDLTTTIGADLPAIYVTVAPQHLLLLDGYNTSTDGWSNVGTEGGVWSLSGVAPTKETGGEVTFNGSNGLTNTIAASASADYCIWAKFTWNNNAEIKTIFEMSNNRQMEVLTGGGVRLKSTINQTTSGTIATSTEYNMICEHLADGSFYIRIENNAGSLILEQTLTGTGTFGLNSGVATIFEDLEATNRNVGSLWEFGVKHGTVSAGNKTDILTRLKSL
jgi:hypothetical protein